MMSKHEKIISGYEQQQTKLRAKISALKSGMSIGDDKAQLDRSATIRRTQRQIADLDRAIMRLREKDAT
jgi:hypothetical protein